MDALNVSGCHHNSLLRSTTCFFFVFSFQLNITSCFTSTVEKSVYPQTSLCLTSFLFSRVSFCLEERKERKLEATNQNKCLFLTGFPESQICVISVWALSKLNLLRTSPSFSIPRCDAWMPCSMLFRKTRCERMSFWPSDVQHFAHKLTKESILASRESAAPPSLIRLLSPKWNMRSGPASLPCLRILPRGILVHYVSALKIRGIGKKLLTPCNFISLP